MRRPGFEPGLPDWQSDVLDQTGRPSQPSNDEKNIAYFNCFFVPSALFLIKVTIKNPEIDGLLPSSVINIRSNYLLILYPRYD
jgi:hypothetical protein